jgi:hemolysin activation/secretion protein
LSEITAGYGIREDSNNDENQFRIRFNSEMNLSLSKRSYLNLRNLTGYLNSKTFLTNELFRIGGANSIRGFNEQSIFTNQFSHLNIEYRYLTSNDSYLHTITDFGVYNNMSQNDTDSLLGLGFGYLFSVENNQVNLGYVLGIRPGESFKFDQSKLIIRFTSRF